MMEEEHISENEWSMLADEAELDKIGGDTTSSNNEEYSSPGKHLMPASSTSTGLYHSISVWSTLTRLEHLTPARFTPAGSQHSTPIPAGPEHSMPTRTMIAAPHHLTPPKTAASGPVHSARLTPITTQAIKPRLVTPVKSTYTCSAARRTLITTQVAKRRLVTPAKSSSAKPKNSEPASFVSTKPEDSKPASSTPAGPYNLKPTDSTPAGPYNLKPANSTPAGPYNLKPTNSTPAGPYNLKPTNSTPAGPDHPDNLMPACSRPTNSTPMKRTRPKDFTLVRSTPIGTEQSNLNEISPLPSSSQNLERPTSTCRVNELQGSLDFGKDIKLPTKARIAAGMRTSPVKTKRTSTVVVLKAEPSTLNENGEQIASEEEPMETSALESSPSRHDRCSDEVKRFCEVCSKDDCGKCSYCKEEGTPHLSCKEKPKSRCVTYLALQQLKRSSRRSIRIAVTAEITFPPHDGCVDKGPLVENSTTMVQSCRTINDTASVHSHLDDVISSQPSQSKQDLLTSNAPCSSQSDTIPAEATNEQDTITVKLSSGKRKRGDSSQEAASLPARKKSRTSCTEDLDDEMKETYQRGLANGVITLHVVKCGTSGPPNTGKTLVRALMTGKPRPSVRSSTAVATESDQITPDHGRFEDVINMKARGHKWRSFSKESMATAVANTLYNKDYRLEDKKGDDKEDDYKKDDNDQKDDAETSNTSVQCSESQPEWNIVRKVKKQLHDMKSKGKKVRKRMGLHTIRLLYFVDTGGQSQFQEILPNFIKCDINLLVHDLSKELQDHPKFNYVADDKEFKAPEGMTESNLDTIETAVQSIVSTKFGREQSSHVAIIGTFKDKCCSDQDKFHTMLKKRSDAIIKRIDKYTGVGEGKCELIPGPSKSRDVKIFSVDGSEQEWDNDHPDLEDLKNKIEAIAESAERRKVVPIRYYIFLQILKEFTEKNKLPLISLQKCIDIATSSDIFMTPTDVKQALELFNECNVLLYFPEILPETVFVRPEFLFGKVTNLIVQSFEFDGGVVTKDHRHFSKTGVFSAKFFECAVKLPNIEFTHESFLTLLKGLYIIVDLKPGRYFMPCVLPLIDPSNAALEDIKKNMKDSKIDGPLVLKFVHDMSPRGLFCSLIIALAGMPGWKVNERSKLLHRNLAVFGIEKKDEKRQHVNRLGRAVIVNHTSRIEVYSTCPPKYCARIRKSTIEAIAKACQCIGYDHRDLFYTGFQCTTCAGNLLHFTDVYLDGEWKERCLNHIHTKRPAPLTDKRLVWFADESADTKEEFLSLLMSEIAAHTTEWKIIGMQLGISRSKLDCIEADKHERSERFAAVFECWYNNMELPFTWETIINALKKVGKERLAKDLSETYLM